MTRDAHFITANDKRAAVAFLRALADEDLDAMTIATDTIDNPWSLVGQFGSCLIDYVDLAHEHGIGPSFDDTLALWGIASATCEQP